MRYNTHVFDEIIVITQVDHHDWLYQGKRTSKAIDN